MTKISALNSVRYTFLDFTAFVSMYKSKKYLFVSVISNLMVQIYILRNCHLHVYSIWIESYHLAKLLTICFEYPNSIRLPIPCRDEFSIAQAFSQNCRRKFQCMFNTW